MEETALPRCVTCGGELHPERAAKYNYCMSRVSRYLVTQIILAAKNRGKL